MKEYNYLQAIYMSFYSRKLYRDIVQHWGGGVVLYLFILLLLCWVAMMFRIQPTINIGLKQISDKYVMQLPEIKFKDGQAQTPENKPYFITEPNAGKVIGVIDTSGKYKTLDDVPKTAQMLLTNDMVYYYDNSNNIKSGTIPKTLNADLKPEQIKTSIIKFGGWLWILLLPFFLLGSFIYRLVQALLYAIIGKIFAALGSISLDYSNVLKLSMIAITPAIILGTILDWFDVTFHLQWLLYFVIAMVYLVFALGANRAK